jgi:hypothetical protein
MRRIKLVGGTGIAVHARTEIVEYPQNGALQGTSKGIHIRVGRIESGVEA